MCVSTKLQPHRMAVYVRLSFCPSFHLSFFPMLLCSFCQSVRPSVVPSFLISVFHVLLRSSYFLPPFSPVIYFVPSFTPSFSPDFLRSFFPSIICHSVCLFVCFVCRSTQRFFVLCWEVTFSGYKKALNNISVQSGFTNAEACI